MVNVSLASTIVSIILFTVSATFAHVSNYASDVTVEKTSKVFFSTGAVSGDVLAAWYYKKLKADEPHLESEAIAGSCMEQEGVLLYKHFNQIEATHLLASSGIGSRLCKIPSVMRAAGKVADYIVEHQFTDLVAVDFPFFNGPLIRAVKKRAKNIRVTYIAPPELWFWRSWGMHYALKKYCDRIIVLYPFEKTWYKKTYNLETEWLGYPLYNEIKDSRKKQLVRKNIIALNPGSRMSHVQGFLPTLAEFAKRFHNKQPDVRFILPLADTVDRNVIEQTLETYGITHLVTLIIGKKNHYKALQTACIAISLPGTLTLELALLKVPSIVMCNINWFTYLVSWLITPQKYAALPNIFLNRELFKELHQGNATISQLLLEVEKLYDSYQTNGPYYRNVLDGLEELDQQFQQVVSP